MIGVTEIDIIILSSGHNNSAKHITQNCIDSLIASENAEHIKFNILVIESHKDLMPFQYDLSITIYPEDEFSHNKYLNIGIEMTDSKYLCLCNNDLIFHPGWASQMLVAFDQNPDLSSASPACSKHHLKMGYKLNSGLYTGYRSNYELASWCIFLKRDALRITGKLDENFKYWCVDNDYANMLSVLRLRHALVTSSIVDHLNIGSLNIEVDDAETRITDHEFFYYEKKWNCRIDARAFKELYSTFKSA